MSPRDKSKPRTIRHSIGDHALGALAAHFHTPDEEHDHDHDGMDLLPGSAADDVALTSIGIDIGSSGTQVAFARLVLERGWGGDVGADPVRADSAVILDRRSDTSVASRVEDPAKDAAEGVRVLCREGTMRPADESYAGSPTLARQGLASVEDDGADVTAYGPDPASQTSRRDVRRRETLYQSPNYLTPYSDAATIDETALGALIDHAFAGAGLTADEIDCGVVILTGAARARDNAEAIARALAERCGDIVSASAGHHMEARLAAHGSGAVTRSAEFGQRYLVVDIGGATTKLAICDNGRVVATAALAIGGRLVATDKIDAIVRLEPWGQRHAADAGIPWEHGGMAPWAERQTVALHMADALVTALRSTGCGSAHRVGMLAGDTDQEERTAPSRLGSDPASQEPACNHTPHVAGSAPNSIWLTPPLPDLAGIDGMIVSGGVGEYVYGRETRSFGDLGLPLGRAFAAHIDAGALPWPLLPAAECIRATVLGASTCSVQLSGRTGCISDPARLLPQRNLPVVQLDLALAETIKTATVAGAIRDELAHLDLDPAAPCVLALRWQGEPEHLRLKALADGVKRGFKTRIDAGMGLYIIVDADIAGSLGAILQDELGVAGDLLVLDGIALSDLDTVDLGRIRLPSGTVPVTIKTLVFRDEQRQNPGRLPRPK